MKHNATKKTTPETRTDSPITEALERTRYVFSDNQPVCPNVVIAYIEAELQSIREERTHNISLNITNASYTPNVQHTSHHAVCTISLSPQSKLLIETK